jgi:hypothetical protein
VVQRAFEYGTGRPAGGGDAAWLEFAIAQFSADGYRYPALIRRIATSPALAASAPGSLAANLTTNRRTR